MKASPRVVICGGGVAALEALLALRQLLAIRPHIDLIAPSEEFVYQPMAVAEPFGLAHTRVLDLAATAEELGARMRLDALVRVSGADRCLVLASGEHVDYDAALVAVGARPRAWLAGALHFSGADDVGTFARLLGRLERGEVSELAFVCPQGTSWTLPLYELALLTASRLAEIGVTGVRLTVLTPEASPLAVFGSAAGRMLRDELSARGIRLRAGMAAERLAGRRLELSTGEAMDVEEVVALPRLEGPHVQGLPADADGFILVDDHCRVAGLDDVYAAGDGTAFPIKQGGIAAQQADVAAASIAALLGAPVQVQAFVPLLRGMLLTGIAPMYLRASLDAAASGSGEVAANPLWSPPMKLAGRYIGPYLARASTLGGHPTLVDLPMLSGDPEAQRAERGETRELALILAEADARAGDYRSALGWLEVVERLDGVLLAEYLDKRDAWRTLADAG